MDQITLDTLILPDGDGYEGECDYCEWRNSISLCPKKDKNNRCSWMPDTWKIPKLCGNCIHRNQYIYEGSQDNPVENNKLYCKLEGGGVNRRELYKNYRWDNFGVGKWHRQHEWDTCDAWEGNI